MDTNTTQSDITAERAGRSTWIPERVVGKFLPVPSCAQGCPRENQDPPRNKEKELGKMSNPAGISGTPQSPPPEKVTQRCTKKLEAAAKIQVISPRANLVNQKTAFTGDAESCFSSLSELPLVQAPPSTYTPGSSTCGWCPASSCTLSAAFIGGEARPVTVATQILAASPRLPPPRSRPQTRREMRLKRCWRQLERWMSNRTFRLSERRKNHLIPSTTVYSARSSLTCVPWQGSGRAG